MSKEDEHFSIVKFFDAKNAEESYSTFSASQKATELALHMAYSGLTSTVRAFGRYNRQGASVGLMIRLKLDTQARLWSNYQVQERSDLVHPGAQSTPGESKSSGDKDLEEGRAIGWLEEQNTYGVG
jgi:hypothetical protein